MDFFNNIYIVEKVQIQVKFLLRIIAITRVCLFASKHPRDIFAFGPSLRLYDWIHYHGTCFGFTFQNSLKGYLEFVIEFPCSGWCYGLITSHLCAAFLVPSHYLEQWWIVNRKIAIIFHWTFIWYSNVFIRTIGTEMLSAKCWSFCYVLIFVG